MSETPTARWKSQPVFISSTFLDMHAERDHLKNEVFPELEELLAARRRHLEPIDLRWGVETLSEEDASSKELVVLKVCLDEIRRSRPFLIAIIGDRYGWVPPEERMKASTLEAGYETEVENKSVTSLEVEFGILRSEAQKLRSHIYLRKPLPYDSMPDDVAARFSDRHNPDPRAAEWAKQLDALKDRITSDPSLKSRVRGYAAEWDAESNRVVGLEAWGRQVVKDIWRDLEEELLSDAEEAPRSWQEEELWALDAFFEQRRRGFQGREELLGELVKTATAVEDNYGTWGSFVTGGDGSGKSALIAQLSRLLWDEDVWALSHATGVTSASDSLDKMLARWCGELAGLLDLPARDVDSLAGPALEQLFSELLVHAAQTRRVVLMVDGLDKFTDVMRAMSLSWLPPQWPKNARLCAACDSDEYKHGSFEYSLQQHMLDDWRPLPELAPEDARDIVVDICLRYHRRLHAEIVDVLLAKKDAEGGLACGTPLYVVLAVEELNLIDADDFARADREFEGPPEQRLHQLLLDVADRMPASPGEMHAWTLKRVEGVVGAELARSFIRLLNIGRAGWREQDLEALIPKLTGEPFDPLRFAVLRRLLRGRLVQSGQFGQWRIADQSLWWTVRRELQADPPLWIHMASAVADYLEPLSRDDPMRQEEYLQQLIPARRPATLVAGYTDDALSESELLAIERTFCWEILTTMREGRDNSGVEYILYLLFLQEVDDRQRCLLCGRVLDRLLPSLEHNTPLTVRRQLLDGVDRALASLAERMQDDVGWLATRAAYEGLNGLHAQKEGNHAPALAALEESRALWQRAVDQRDDASEAPRIEWRQALAEACQAIGHRYLGADQPTRAQGCFKEARQVLESLLLEAPGNRVAKALLGAAHDDLGDVLKTQGDLEGALESFERGRDIFEQLETKEPDELNWKHHLAVNGERIGNMLGGLGRSQACLEAHQKTLELREFLTKRAPYDVNQQKNLAITLRDVGDALKDVGEPPAAPYMQYSRARRIYEHLLAEGPGDTRVAMLLAGLLERYDTSMDVISGRQPGSGLKDAIGIWKGLVEHDPDNAQWRRGLARAYRKTGEVLQDAHASEKAAQAYRQSLEHLQHLVVLDPTDVSLQATLAGVHRDIGDGMLDTGNPAAAAASFQEALSLDERIIAQRPDRQSDRRTARDFLNLGMAYKQMGRYKDAVNALDRTSEIARRRLDEAADDGFRHDLFVAIDHKGEMLLAEDDCDGALQCFEEGLRHMLASNADEWEAEDYHNQGIAHQRIGTVLLKQGDAEKARERFEQTRDLCQKALDMEPDSLNRLYQMSNANGKLGNALLGQGDIEAARIAYQSSLKVCEKLAERDPTNPQWTRNLGITREKLADVALAENDVPAALEALGEADRIRSKLQAEHPDDAALTRDLAVSAYRTAEILGQTGQGQAAQPHIFRLHQILSHMQKAGMYIDPPLQDVLQRLEQQGIAQDIAAAAQQQETGTTTLKCPACGAAVMSMRGRRRMQGGTVGCGTCGKSFPSEQLVAEYKEE